MNDPNREPTEPDNSRQAETEQVERHEHSNPGERRPARSEVDDFAAGAREPQPAPRGGFATEQDAGIPGGTTGEHSGQTEETEED